MERLERLDEWAGRLGFRAAAAGPEALEAVRKAIEERRRKGELSPGFYKRSLSGFRYPGSTGRPNRKFVIVVAFPRPAHIIGFTMKSGRFEALLPPTYVGYRDSWETIRRDLAENTFGRNDALHTLSIPLKSLAVWTGLASYGRNNIAYVPGLGSYFQLAAYAVNDDVQVSDIPIKAGRGPFRIDRMMDLCANCLICAEACPTGAISGDRFLIDATKCYTYHSESPDPMPPGMDPPSPNCILGCLRCQTACPGNRGLLRKEPGGVDLDEEETAAFLAEGELPGNSIGAGIRAKFDSLAMTEDIRLCRRNLRLLLSR